MDVSKHKLFMLYLLLNQNLFIQYILEILCSHICSMPFNLIMCVLVFDMCVMFRFYMFVCFYIRENKLNPFKLTQNFDILDVFY